MNLFQYDDSYKDLLDKYVNHPTTPINNSDLLFIEIYDNVNGAMFFIEDNNEIVAAFGVLKVEMFDGTIIGKLPSRLHIREDYRKHHHKFIDQYFDPVVYRWLHENDINNVMQTVNVGNERPGFLSWQRHNRRRRDAYKWCDDFGQEMILKKWTILPYIINEKNTWQYCAWVSWDDKKWDINWRDFDHIQPEVIEQLDKNFDYIPLQGWIF